MTPFFFSKLILFSFLLLGLGCTKTSRIENETVAQIGSQKITVAEFSKAVAKRAEEHHSAPLLNPEYFKRLKLLTLRSMISDRLIDHLAQKQNITVTQAEIDAETERIRKQYGNDIEFRKSISNLEMTFDQWQKLTQNRLLRVKLSQAVVNVPEITPDKVRADYEKNKDLYKERAQVLLRQIVLEKEESAKTILDLLIQGKYDFETLAKKYSISPEGRKGGNLGWIQKGVLDVFDRSFKMRKGERGSVIKSDYGYHIIEVLDKKVDRKLPFNEVEAEIKRKLSAEAADIAFSVYLEEKLRLTPIELNQKLIDSLEIKPNLTSGG